MSTPDLSHLVIYTDGGSRGNPGEAAYGFVVYTPEKEVIHKEGVRIGIATNNVAEYMAILSAFRWVDATAPTPPTTIEFFMDSELAASQLTGIYRVKNEKLRELFLEIKSLEKKIGGKISYTAIRRAFNKAADSMVNLALDGQI